MSGQDWFSFWIWFGLHYRATLAVDGGLIMVGG